MLIVGDQGDAAVNADEVFSFALGTMNQDGTAVLVAHAAAGMQIILAAVADRPRRALDAIVKAQKEGWKIVNLLDLLGPRPDLAVARTLDVVRANGQPK